MRRGDLSSEALRTKRSGFRSGDRKPFSSTDDCETEDSRRFSLRAWFSPPTYREFP